MNGRIHIGTDPRPAWHLVALVLVGMLLLIRLTQPLPWLAKGIVVALAALSTANPLAGLLIFAGLAPVTTALAALLGAAGGGTVLLEQLALSATLGPFLHRRLGGGGTRLGGPAIAAAIVAATSAVTLIPARMAALSEGSDTVGRLIRGFLEGSYEDPVWPALLAAVYVIECALLGLAVERQVRANPSSVPRLLMMSLAGHAGAAALNVSRIATVAARTGDFWQTVWLRLLDTRASIQMDFNAGGSALVLAAVAGLALMRHSTRQKGLVALGVLTVAAGIWITGSRAAILMAMFVPALFGVWRLIRRSPRRLVWLSGLLAVLLVVGIWTSLHYPAGRNDTFSGSIRSRLVLVELGVRMFQSAPVFGIGLGEFFETSARLGGPDLAAQVGAPRENAHNNFVQVLAEQGAVGLGALLLLLATVLLVARVKAPPDFGSERIWLSAGLAAAAGTWLTGHPLLVPEFAFVFWLYCGMAAGLAPPWPWRQTRWLALATLVVALTAVPRAIAVRDQADLEHLGRGLSQWQHDDDQRYRTADPDFVLFLPALGEPVTVPVRRAPGAPEFLRLEWQGEHGHTDTVMLAGDGWQDVRVLLAAGRRRYVAVRFTLRLPDGAPATAPLLRVGRDLVR